MFFVLKKLLDEERVFLDGITKVLMKLMQSEVISDAEGQMARIGKPFFEGEDEFSVKLE